MRLEQIMILLEQSHKLDQELRLLPGDFEEMLAMRRNEYSLHCAADRLRDIVYDFVGIPKDETIEDPVNGYCRDWLIDKWYEASNKDSTFFMRYAEDILNEGARFRQ